MPVDEHVIELLPGYALGCLDEAEQAQVFRHLEACHACRTELRAYQAVVERLPLAVTPAQPPARVKQALMRRVEAQGHQPGHSPGTAKTQPSAWQRIDTLLRNASPVWSLASLALILVLAASNLFLWLQLNRLSEASITVTPSDETMGLVSLYGDGPAQNATGLLVISVNGQHGTLVVDDLPSLGEDQQYQLWLVDDAGKRTSGGVFSVGKSGYASLWVSSPQPLESYPAFGVTVEPYGGSPGPTGERVLAGEFEG